MSATGSVTADELVRALERRGATLPAEIGTFMVLEGAEAMLASGPRGLTGLSQLRVSEQGAIAVSGSACDDEQGARALHQALKQLLEAAGPRLPPALVRLVEVGPSGGSYSLRALRDELEAALVPLNRTASRRVLSRFVRDAMLAPIDPEDVDAALSSLIDASEPANDVSGRPSHARVTDAAEHAAHEASFLGGPVATELHEPLSTRRSPSLRPSFFPPSESEGLRGGGENLREEDEGARSRKLLIGFGLLAAALLAVALVATLRTQRKAAPSADQAALESELGASHTATPSTRGDVIVNIEQGNAQVLRYVGNAPTWVPDVALGVAHEFVATAEGHEPARVVVPATAEWERTAEGPRYEVALQLTPVSSAPSPLGPPLLPTASSGSTGHVGSVRVVATPRGARVYHLVGFGSTIELHDVALATSLELLIAREGAAPLVRVLDRSNFRQREGRMVAELRVGAGP